MHQHGVGLRQDFHLAKRFFDASAQTHADARWPVNLALAGLYLHWWYSGEAGGITDRPIVRTGKPDAVLLDSVGVVAEVRRAVGRWRARLLRVWDRLVPPLEEGEWDGEGEEGVGGMQWDWEGWVDGMKRRAPAVDTVLIAVLTVALWYVLRVRAEQREAAARRRREQLQQQQGGGASMAAAGGGPPRAHQD